MLTGEALKSGMYLGAYTLLLSATLSNFSTFPGEVELSKTGTGLAVGGLMGYQWVWNSGFNLNVGAGYGASTLREVRLNFRDTNLPAAGISGPNGSGILGGLKAEISVGYIL